jgi:hypothetical protein
VQPGAGLQPRHYVTNWEEYLSTYYGHAATIDSGNNLGPPRRARIGFTVGF